MHFNQVRKRKCRLTFSRGARQYLPETERGMAVRIAEACGIHKSSVYQWRRVPPQWVQVVAELIDMEPEQIRPDIFRPRKHPAKNSRPLLSEQLDQDHARRDQRRARA